MHDRRTEQALLERITRKGWTERSGQQFESVFGERIRWLVVTTMERVGALQWRVHPNRTHSLADRRSALYDNTLSDLWYELLGGVVETYVEGVRSQRIGQAFIPYLHGVVRHLVVANARSLRIIGRESTAELLTMVCEAKRESTYLDRLAWLKFCLEKRVREELLALSEPDAFKLIYRSIHRVSDYFFEKYVPSQCERVSSSRGSVLSDLLRDFSKVAIETEAHHYIGEVTPIARNVDDGARAPDGQQEGEYLAVMARAREGRWQ